MQLWDLGMIIWQLPNSEYVAVSAAWPREKEPPEMEDLDPALYYKRLPAVSLTRNGDYPRAAMASVLRSTEKLYYKDLLQRPLPLESLPLILVSPAGFKFDIPLRFENREHWIFPAVQKIFRAWKKGIAYVG